MTDKQYCNKCTSELQGAARAVDADDSFCLLDQIWTCSDHAPQYLDEFENRLLHSTNRATSITEQRMLDDIQVLKMRYKKR